MEIGKLPIIFLITKSTYSAVVAVVVVAEAVAVVAISPKVILLLPRIRSIRSLSVLGEKEQMLAIVRMSIQMLIMEGHPVLLIS